MPIFIGFGERGRIGGADNYGLAVALSRGFGESSNGMRRPGFARVVLQHAALLFLGGLFGRLRLGRLHSAGATSILVALMEASVSQPGTRLHVPCPTTVTLLPMVKANCARPASCRPA